MTYRLKMRCYVDRAVDEHPLGCWKCLIVIEKIRAQFFERFAELLRAEQELRGELHLAKTWGRELAKRLEEYESRKEGP